MIELDKYYWEYDKKVGEATVGAYDYFVAGWLARDVYEKDQLAKSLAEFDNDDNDCGSGGCIL